jgi:Second Messenger Oligonucleotide or Dinucleotide Synthetase domain
MAVDLAANFQTFLDNISLGDPQVPRMNSAAEQNVFLQGSYANHTAIEPVDGGEYDIDLVAICTGDGISADQALNDLESRFRADGRFRERVTRKKPCVRLEYAEDDVGAFHVDVVPLRSGIGVGPSPTLEAPRRQEGWRETAPAEYTDWCRRQGNLYLRTVKMLKRWRGEQQSVRTAIKSIVLQVLIAGCMPSIDDDALRIAETIAIIYPNRPSTFAATPSAVAGSDTRDETPPCTPIVTGALCWPVAPLPSYHRTVALQISTLGLRILTST